MNMYESFLTNSQRPIQKWLHYFPVYERYFERFQNRSIVMYEIGVFQGGSLQFWKKYFGPFATIVGIDINPNCKSMEETQVHVRIGDQSDHKFLQEVFDEFGPPDIVLDDGSHQQDHINATLEFFYTRMKPESVYLIEDVHTAYFPSYGGGLLQENTIIERCKGLVDFLNGYYCDLPTEFADSTFSIALYDSIIVLEKKQWPKGLRVAPLVANGTQSEIDAEFLVYKEKLLVQEQMKMQEQLKQEEDFNLEEHK